MLYLKRLANCLFRYILGIIIAILACGILALIFKLLLITVQGPTIISQLSDVFVFYGTLSIAFFFLFRNYGVKQLTCNIKEFSIYIIITVVLHAIIIISVDSWSGIWFISTGTGTFVKVMYTGVDGLGRSIKSYSEIPRMYYYIALMIEDVCFIVFSFLGYCIGFFKTNTNIDNNH